MKVNGIMLGTFDREKTDSPKVVELSSPEGTKKKGRKTTYAKRDKTRGKLGTGDEKREDEGDSRERERVKEGYQTKVHKMTILPPLTEFLSFLSDFSIQTRWNRNCYCGRKGFVCSH